MSDFSSLSKEEQLFRIRHSLAHILAMAVQELRPGTKLGFGPPIEDGFYYDFILSEPLTEENFNEIEKKMKHILKQNHKFEKKELDHDPALEKITQMGEPYKREYAQELFQKKNLKTLSFYQTGKFVDMCDGPHVPDTRVIPANAFKLRSISGAYWRADQKNQMMTRIYAWAFLTKEELDAHVTEYKLAQERDHRKLGRELDIFVIDDTIGKGLPLWLPNGTVVRDELQKLMNELEFKAGYHRVATPHLAKTDLYYKTGHLPYYAVHMYPFMELKEKVDLAEEGTSSEIEIKESYALKPMNCPHHHKIFAARMRSYRDLPMRLAEYGQVYRFEESGALAGLLRVRGMCMNDAHIYCTEDQIKHEFQSVMKMHAEVYKILGITNYKMRLSTWDPEDPKGKEKYVHNPKAWEYTQKKVREAMDELGLSYTEGKGEAAFYGPKIDFQFRSVTGREETASTCQLDFSSAERLDLKYKGSDNQEHRPYIIHRAPLGTHERFVAFLLEHYGGAFPTWLAPVQVRVICIAEAFYDYAQKIVSDLRSEFVRAEIDLSSETFNKKIRNAVTSKIPNLFIIGERERNEGKITLRQYGKQEQKSMPVREAFDLLRDKIQNRTLEK
ncbi:MAG: threonine--tRNA ligase [Bacteriovoracia bacterium]